jgi:hypothetical protein
MLLQRRRSNKKSPTKSIQCISIRLSWDQGNAARRSNSPASGWLNFQMTSVRRGQAQRVEMKDDVKVEVDWLLFVLKYRSTRILRFKTAGPGKIKTKGFPALSKRDELIHYWLQIYRDRMRPRLLGHCKRNGERSNLPSPIPSPFAMLSTLQVSPTSTERDDHNSDMESAADRHAVLT